MQDILMGNWILQLPGKWDSLKFKHGVQDFWPVYMWGIHETIRLSKQELKCESINQVHVSVGCFQTKLQSMPY